MPHASDKVNGVLSHDESVRLGLAALRSCQYDAAVAHFTAGIAQDPGDWRDYVGLGQAHQHAGRVEASVAALRRACELAPSLPQPCVALGDVLKSSGRHSDAIASYDRALERSPFFGPALREKARAKAALGEWPEAFAMQLRRPRSFRNASCQSPFVDLSPVNTARRSADCTVTFIAGRAFSLSDGVAVYIRSLANVFKGAKYALVHDIARDTHKELQHRGFSVLSVASVEHLTRDRWLAFYHLLSALDHAACVLSDSKDVVFQRDPFPLFTSDGIHFVSEELTHAQLSWNLDQQYGLQSSIGVRCDLSGTPVINAGVVCGSVARLREFSILMYSNLLTSDPDSSDQAMLNLLYHAFLHRSTHVLLPSTSRLCAIGASAHYRTTHEMDDGLRWSGEAVSDACGELYALVHQWERTRFASEVRTSALGQSSLSDNTYVGMMRPIGEPAKATARGKACAPATSEGR